MMETMWRTGLLLFTLGTLAAQPVEGWEDGWVLALSRLPLKLIDCEHRETCDRFPGSRCTGLCVWDARKFATDAKRQAIYFQVATGSGSNKPLIIFRYDSKTGRLTRLTNDYGSGFGIGAVSPNGRYLAYIAYYHESAACNPPWLGVVDLQTHRSAMVAPWKNHHTARRPVEVLDLTWETNGSVNVRTNVGATACDANADAVQTPESYRASVRELTFK
jgi:hypothetical protein